MRHVVFVAPFPLETTIRFSSAIKKLEDVVLTGIFQEAPKGEAAVLFQDLQVVQNVWDPGQVVAAVRALERDHGPAHRLLGILEDLQTPLALARQKLGLPGTDPETSHRFRDKGVMKAVLRKAGVPCARAARIQSEADGWSFADQVGYPMVLKPPTGAGCRSTYRVDNPQQLAQALAEIDPSPDREVLGEEFLTGSEFTFETLTLNGEIRFHSIARYYPSPLEVMHKPWVQWVVLLPRDISGPEFDDVREVGARVIKALGLQTSVTHMEWFRRPDGSIAVGEIAARPPGAQIVELIGQAHDIDMHQAWARLMVDDAVDEPFERKYACGVAFLRGAGQGRVSSVDGLSEAQERMGHLVTKAQLPRVGAWRRSGYEGEGWAIVRHPETEVVQRALFDLITTVKVGYR